MTQPRISRVKFDPRVSVAPQGPADVITLDQNQSFAERLSLPEPRVDGSNSNATSSSNAAPIAEIAGEQRQPPHSDYRSPVGNPCSPRNRPSDGKAVKRDTKRTLSVAQARALVNASAYAERQEVPLNALLTITWRFLPVYTEAALPRLQTDLLDKLARFLRRRGIGTGFVWVRERARGQGLHSHVALDAGPHPKLTGQAVLAFLQRAFEFGKRGVHILCA